MVATGPQSQDDSWGVGSSSLVSLLLEATSLSLPHLQCTVCRPHTNYDILHIECYVKLSEKDPLRVTQGRLAPPGV